MTAAHTFPHRWSYFILLTLLYLLATSQAIQSFSYKWTTIATHKQYSLDKTLEFETPKPYIYRVFMPYIVNVLIDSAPSTLLKKLIERSNNTLQANIGSEVELMSDKAVAAYAVIILLDFIFLFLTLWTLRAASKITIRNGNLISNVVTDFCPVLFSLMLTLSYRVENGFIYDHLELLCLSIYVLSTMHRNSLLSIMTLFIAIFNKETAVFFPLLGATIYLAADWNKLRASHNYLNLSFKNSFLIKLVLESMVVACGYVLIHYIFNNAPGGAIEFHGPGNFWFWCSFEPWISVTTPHLQLIPLPKPTNILIFLPILIVIFGSWNKKPNAIRFPLMASIVINIPLFALFAYRDEFRNLSLIFPFAYLAALHSITSHYELNGFKGNNESH